MKHQIQQPVSPKYTVSSSLVLKNQETGLSIISGYYHTGDDQTQLTRYTCTSVPGSSAYWFAIISQCFTILKKTTSSSVTILAHNISRSTCYRSCVFPKYLLSFLGNFSTLLVLKPWFLVVKEKRIS